MLTIFQKLKERAIDPARWIHPIAALELYLWLIVYGFSLNVIVKVGQLSLYPFETIEFCLQVDV